MLTCSDCGRDRPSAQHSDEFNAVICDGCYGHALRQVQDQRERAVATATRIHFDHIRHARETNVWLGTD